MSRTLFRYIFWDLLKIFAITSAILTGIMSFGGLLRPLTEHGLKPGQVATMLTYFWPAMTTYSIPVAALFATTMVYGRLSADNELTAARAAGISAFAISIPAFVLGLLSMALGFILLFFVVPVFTLKVEQVIYSNVAQLVQNQIERNHRIQFNPPGGRPLTIFAQSAQLLPPTHDRPRDQVVQLAAPLFVRYERSDRDKRDRIPVPIDFYIARSATAYISQDESSGELLLQAVLDGGMKFPRHMRGNREQSLQVSVENAAFTSDPMPSPVRENTKFMGYGRLQELLENPEQSKRLRGLLNEFIRDDQQREYLRRLGEALELDGVVRLDAGDESYLLESRGAKIDARNNKLVIGSLEGPPTDELPRLTAEGGQGLLSVVGREITIRAVPMLTIPRDPANGSSTTPRERRLNVELEFTNASVSAGSVTTPRSRFERTFSVPMPADLLAFEDRRVDDYTVPHTASVNRALILERNWLKLTNSIKSEIHSRASFSIACLVLVMLGCALGMMFRSGNFLSAFAISVIPAMLTILLIISGQHTCENVPWNFQDFKQNQLQFGLAMIWSGNAIVFALGIGLMWRLQRQ